MQSFKEEIKELMRSGKTSDALTALLDSSKDNKMLHESINLVIAEHNALNNQKLRGTITDDEASRKSSIINDKILIALDSFNESGTILPNVKVNKFGRSTKILLILGLSIFILGLIAFLIAYRFEAQIGNTETGIVLIVGIYLIQGGLIVLAVWLVAFLWQAIKGH